MNTTLPNNLVFYCGFFLCCWVIFSCKNYSPNLHFIELATFIQGYAFSKMYICYVVWWRQFSICSTIYLKKSQKIEELKKHTHTSFEYLWIAIIIITFYILIQFGGIRIRFLKKKLILNEDKFRIISTYFYSSLVFLFFFSAP